MFSVIEFFKACFILFSRSAEDRIPLWPHAPTGRPLRRHQGVRNQIIRRVLDRPEILSVPWVELAVFDEYLNLGRLQFDTYNKPLQSPAAAILAHALGGRGCGTGWVGIQWRTTQFLFRHFLFSLPVQSRNERRKCRNGLDK